MSDKIEYVEFHVPTKPYSLIDAINRAALATGSFHNAMAGTSADYNGHYNTIYFNDYRQYYVGEYTWGGRRVFVRTESAVGAVRAGLAEFEQQGRGATLVISVRPEDADAVRAAFPQLLAGKADPNEKPTGMTWKFAEVGCAMRLNQTHLLLRARDPEHYKRLQGHVPTENGYTYDRELAAREWEAVRNLPLPGDEGRAAT